MTNVLNPPKPLLEHLKTILGPPLLSDSDYIYWKLSPGVLKFNIIGNSLVSRLSVIGICQTRYEFPDSKLCQRNWKRRTPWRISLKLRDVSRVTVSELSSRMDFPFVLEWPTRRILGIYGFNIVVFPQSLR